MHQAFFDPAAKREFEACVADLLDTPEVLSMKRIRHHWFGTCYGHSLFVSYVAFRMARRFGWDAREAARAGLLHDLFLYDPHTKGTHPGLQCFDHPVAALENAARLTDLSDAEANAIVSHMWPLASHLPRSRTAVAVNLADKSCAVVELLCLYRLMHLERRLAPVPA